MGRFRTFFVVSIFVVVVFSLCCVGCVNITSIDSKDENLEQLNDFQNNCGDVYHGYNVNFEGAHYFLVDTEKNSVESYISSIISRRNHNPYDISVSKVDYGYVNIRNLSQETLNSYVRLRYSGRMVEGTCTLVAMTIMIDFAEMLGVIPERNYYNIFKDLYDISYDVFGNRYGNPVLENDNSVTYNMDGTPDNQIKPILLEYFERQNISLPIIDEGNVYSDGNKDADNNYVNEISEVLMDCFPVTIVSINNYFRNAENEIDGAHKIAVSGYIQYNVSYKIRPWYALWGVSRQETFNVFTFSNGWENVSQGEEMTSVLIITDEARVSNMQYLDWTY